MTNTVLHFAAHPDDELIGPPATLMALRDAGYRVLNVACGLGRPEQRARRTAELQEASRRAGFEALVPEHPPIATSRTDDIPTVTAEVLQLAKTTIAEYRPEIVLSPTPHDRHPSHELVARALRDALLEDPADPPRWWMWGLWGELPMPTIGTPFEQPRLEDILTALGAYSGELSRNDYESLVRGKAITSATLGSELLFGFGGKEIAPAPYVELLTETILVDGRWLLGTPRWLDTQAPSPPPGDTDIGDWLYAESITERFGGIPSGASRPAVAISDEQRRGQEERLWAFTLHEDGVFNSRQNLFLVAESMLVVAYATALDAKASGSATTIALTALLLTLGWLYASIRHTLIVDHIQTRAKDTFPDYKSLYERRNWPLLRIRSRTVTAFVVPLLVGALWIALLIVQS
jgi:hypothetical protein